MRRDDDPSGAALPPSPLRARPPEPPRRRGLKGGGIRRQMVNRFRSTERTGRSVGIMIMEGSRDTEDGDGAQGLPKKPAPVRSPPPPRTGTLTAIMEIGEFNPVCALCRRAEAPGDARRSPPARAVADYLLSPRRCKAKPAGALRELQRRPSRPSVIGYRLSVIGYQLSAIQGEARLHGLHQHEHFTALPPLDNALTDFLTGNEDISGIPPPSERSGDR